MSCEPTSIVLPPSASAESPQPLPLTTSNSSRCTSPMSPPSDQNVSSNEDESLSGINLTINKSSTSNPNNLNNGSKQHSIAISKRPSMMNHHHMNMSNNNDTIVDSLIRHHSHKMKISSDFSNVNHHQVSRSKSNKIRHQTLDNNNNNCSNMNSPDFNQLLLEYRQVLLDVLTKAILFSENNDGETTNHESIHKGIILPIKCRCGATSELSKQITRTSTYVHQLELKFRSLLESMKVSTDLNRYTPKRPWFINSPASALFPFVPTKVSLLEKKKLSRMSAAEKQQIQQPVSLFSGNSSMNSSLNDDDEDIDSDEDDVNEDNLSGNLNNHVYANGGSMEETNVVGKTILEGYLESMKNVPSEEGSDEEGKDQAEDEEDDITDVLIGPGKRIDVKTKKLVIQMQRNGASFTDISRQIGISRKSVRRIITNYKAFGMLEKKRESRIQKGMQDLILRLYSQGRSYTQISRATAISKPTISKVIKQYIDSNIFAKGPTTSMANGLCSAVNGGVLNGAGLQDSYNDTVDDDMDEEREMMIVDENVGEDEDEQDIDDDEDNVRNEMTIKNDLEPSIINSYTLYPRVHPATHQQAHQNQPINKSKRNLSLIQGPYNGGGNSSGNGYSQMKQHSQYQSSNINNNNSNNNGPIINNRLSLIKPQERYKPYDLKVRHNSSNEMLTNVTHRISKSHPIVPPLPTSTNIYQVQVQPRSQVKLYTNNTNTNSNSSNNNNGNDCENATVQRHKNKMNRHSVDMTFKESLIVPEADKNNNTTLSNCNVTITSTSNNSSGKPNEPSANLPPIPASLIDGTSDSEANLVPKNFIEGFPAGIMNSLNPNRATKLTLEDFNIVWQLRSQHWTHNQIRKYFQQRGKSISKSSISRIMNGKQRNFQQFFNVVPSNSNF